MVDLENLLDMDPVLVGFIITSARIWRVGIRAVRIWRVSSTTAFWLVYLVSSIVDGPVILY